MSACPNCQKTLTLFDYEGIELLHCPDCKSFWFQGEQFRQVKKTGFAKLSELLPDHNAEFDSQSPPEDQEFHCPACQTHILTPYAYAYSSDIQLYRCTQCHGIWAQSSALSRIDALLEGYQESLEEAKAKVMPLMLKVKNQIHQEDRQREEQRKKKGVFNRFFRGKKLKNKKVHNLFEENSQEDDTSQE
ncbi:hypothetical protein CSA56_04720 [candidate division KSB3 bacterium]|uniref:Transcription factor zinc-finger domain-containing protein n=1 Tax=candidate division KSB3 bacterium TaxID=2044937 RepID=A0A2G6KIU1_9BACT|nr:MAG: hypothetical protein CSA56_04720 [candidate division KSB3 bacterium]